MNLIIAAGLFDSPLVVAVIVIVGALVNWLSQRRQAKQQQREEQPQDAAPPTSKQAKGELDMEEVLRRLLGEQSPPPVAAPPPIPRAGGGTPPPPPIWQGRGHTPVLVLPPVSVALPMKESPELSDVEGQAALRFAQTDEQVRQHLIRATPGRRARASRWSGLWRGRASVRRAFVGSLVFGPPKGLEP